MTARVPPAPPPVVLLAICDPLQESSYSRSARYYRRFQLPMSQRISFRRRAIVSVGTGANAGAVTVICPAFPVLDAVLNNPLPAPEMETNSLSTVTANSPTGAISRSYCLEPATPSARLRLLTVSEILPAAPAPSVATEIVPPSPWSTSAWKRVICPGVPRVRRRAE